MTHFNLSSIINGVNVNKESSDLYICPQILDQGNTVARLQEWQKNTSIKNYTAIVKIVNEQGDKHAILVHAKRLGENLDLVRTTIIDPLSENDSKFKKEISTLSDKIKIPGIIHIIYSGRQDKDCTTCGDVSLVMLKEHSEEIIKDNYLNNSKGKSQLDKSGNNYLYDINEVEKQYLVVNKSHEVTYLLNTKLQAQAEYFARTGIVFETLQDAFDHDIVYIGGRINHSHYMAADDIINGITHNLFSVINIANNIHNDLPLSLITPLLLNKLYEELHELNSLRGAEGYTGLNSLDDLVEFPHLIEIPQIREDIQYSGIDSGNNSDKSTYELIINTTLATSTLFSIVQNSVADIYFSLSSTTEIWEETILATDNNFDINII